MSVDHFSLFSFRLKLSFLFSVVPQRLNPISTFQSGRFKIVNISISNGQHGGRGLKFHKKEVCNIWTATKLSDHRILTNIPDHFQSNIFMIMVIRIIIRTIKIINLTDGNYAGQQWTTLSLEKWSLCLL